MKEAANQPTPDETEAPGASTGEGKEDSENALGKDKDPTADHKDPEQGSSQEVAQDTSKGDDKVSETHSKPEESADKEKKAIESSKPENSGTEPSQPESSGDTSDHPPAKAEGSGETSKEQGSRPETLEVKGTADLATSGSRVS